MNAILHKLLAILDSDIPKHSSVIPWGSPVLSFGDITKSKVATLGLNPSNREFVDDAGLELDGDSRRFHTLGSLGISKWSEAEDAHIETLIESYKWYFERNPYNTWFRRLDFIISHSEASFYGEETNACHLDLIPYATSRKWTELSKREQSDLFCVAGDTLANIIVESPVRILVLNGCSVVKQFETMFNIKFEKEIRFDWTLPRKASSGVPGYSYKANVSILSGKKLGRRLLILGYNHNIQSSFGVTKKVMSSIGDWIAHSTRGI